MPKHYFEFDFPGLEIGVAEYEEGPTGCTVFAFERGAVFSADVRGGSPGTVGADIGFARAICFAGGSLMGLEAAAGVASAIFEERGHDHVEWNDVPIVAGAIIFDFGARRNGVYPDKALGAAAYRARKPGILPLGRRGGGRMAGVGKLAIPGTQPEPGGQGGGFRQLGDIKVAAFCVVNALGCVLDRAGNVVRGNLDPKTGRRPTPMDYVDALSGGAGSTPPGNTTLTLVVTNQRLTGRELTQTVAAGACVDGAGNPALPHGQRRRRPVLREHERSRTRGIRGRRAAGFGSL